MYGRIALVSPEAETPLRSCLVEHRRGRPVCRPGNRDNFSEPSKYRLWRHKHMGLPLRLRQNGFYGASTIFIISTGMPCPCGLA